MNTQAQDSMTSGRVLVVDDDMTIRLVVREVLARQFDVITVDSGEAAIAECRARLPDLILLDVTMPGMDGHETCRRLREWTNIPIIFMTGHESLEQHLKAFEAGGTDLLTKPVNDDILLHKVGLCIRMRREATSIEAERDSLQQVAMDFLSSMGENGTLLNFMRASVNCTSHADLAEKLITATNLLGLQCAVLIRSEEGPTLLTSHGEPTPLEYSILEQISGMGRMVQFKRRFAVNYDRVSVIVTNMPDDETHAVQAGRIRDSITILAEVTESLAETVDMRLESMQRAERLQTTLSMAWEIVESLRDRHHSMLADVGMQLHALVREVEKTYDWLGTNQEQELAITQTMGKSVDNILQTMVETGDYDTHFAELIEALRGKQGSRNVELF